MPNLSRRDLAQSAVATIATMALPSGKLLAAEPELGFVDPELRPFAAQMVKMAASMPEISSETLAASRAMMASFSPPPLASPTVEKRAVPGLDGAPDVAVYIVNGKAGAARPAILHTHGGGFITGSAKDMLADLQKTAALLDCVIVTVDYRLAPETTYAGSTGDTYAALQWLYRHAAEVGADPRRIAVMGESAGGGLAALLALNARDRGEVPLVAQILIYPMLDDRTGTTRHPPSPVGTILWTQVKNRFGWRAFLGQAPGTDLVPERAVPARRKDLKGLAPAFIGVGSIDLFVDEDKAYASALTEAGVPTELVVVPGAFHGFDGIAADTSVAKAFTARKIAALRRAFDQQGGQGSSGEGQGR